MRRIKNSASAVMLVYAGLLFAMSLGVLVYDIVTIVNDTVDPNEHVPFLWSVVGGIFGGLLVWLAWHDRHLPPDDPGRDSYLHPDHHPTGRRDAPDGTSD